MNTAHLAYRQSQKTSLTRIDMLIRLYDKTLKTLAEGVPSLRAGDEVQYEAHKFTLLRCIVALLDGIDPTQGEVSENTQRICLYAVGLIQDGTEDSFEDAARILQPIHDSFVQIRNEAVVLELEGEIPSLDFQSGYEQTVL